MSDPMAGMPRNGGPGGPMGAGPGPRGDGGAALAGQRSVFHPTDMSAMQQTGDVSQNMTIAQFFQKFGIDVNKDPVSKLAQFTQDQLSKANPVNKMSALAGGGGGSPTGGGGTPPSGGPAGGGPSAPPPGGGGLADLAQSMGGR